MAKKVAQESYYVFTPSADTIVIPRIIQRSQLMLITNVSTNQVIYNFSDPDLNATSYTIDGSATSPKTTIVLNYNCEEMQSTDKLQIMYDEYDEKFTPSDNLVDAVAKMRVAAPQSLIDTDFEYGTQGNKWESLTLTQNYPSFFSKGTGGNSFEITDIVGTGGTARTKSRVSVLTTSAHNLATNDVVSVQESLSSNAEGSFSITTPGSISGVTLSGITFSTTTLTKTGHGLVVGQPLAFSNIGSATGIETGTTYYVVTSAPNTFSISASLGGEAISVGGTGTLTVDQGRMFTYLAKGLVTGSIKDDVLTSVSGGGIFDNAHIPGGIGSSLEPWTISTSGTEATVETVDPHGLIPGTPILINGLTGTLSGANGSWIINTVVNPRTFTFLCPATPATDDTIVSGTVALYTKPDSSIQHVAYNGGVSLSTGNNVVGIQQIRQTRKTFRYQSGKSIQFSTGVKFTPSYDIENIVSNTKSGSAVITVTTVQDHGLQEKARVKITGISTIGGDINPYNGDFLVTGIINPNTFTYQTLIPGVGMTNNLNLRPSGENALVTVSSWAGASTRVGMFNDMNGIFLEYDGEKLYACKRYSNKPLFGQVTVTQYSGSVIGTNTRFLRQLVVGDKVVIKGQLYRVIQIDSDTSMFISPSYRGQSVTTGTRMFKVQTDRVSQDNFNIDRLDTTGPSGYNFDATKMQMVYIDYTWYGSGFIRFGLRGVNGDVSYFHRMPNNNINSQSYMRSGNLPARYEVHNYSPKTRLVAGGLAGTMTTLRSGLPLAPTATTMYIENINGVRTTAPSGLADDIIGYMLISQGGNPSSTDLTATSAAGEFTTTPDHKLTVGQAILFSDIGLTSLEPNTTYYVVSVPTAKTFRVSASYDGTPLVPTNGTVTISLGGGNACEVVPYTAVGSYNALVGGYPITIQRQVTLTPAKTAQYVSLGGTEGDGEITASGLESRIITGTSLGTQVSVGNTIYASDGIKLGIVSSVNAFTLTGITFATTTLTLNSHGLSNGNAISFTDIGSATGISLNTTYYVVSSAANTFSVASSVGGTAISIGGTGTLTILASSDNVVELQSPPPAAPLVPPSTTPQPYTNIGFYIANTVPFNGATGSNYFNPDSSVPGSSFYVPELTAAYENNSQVSVRTITQTCAPSLSHWGSSVIMDGGYDEDRGVQFNARMKNYLAITAGQRRPLLSIRIAPSVDNGIGRNFGKREIVNTMQLALSQIETLGTGPFLVEGIFNPTALTSTGFTNPTSWETVSIGSGSLAQIIYHDGTDVAGALPATSTGNVQGGDVIFSFYTDNSGGTNLGITRFDLENVKELGTSILSGNGSVATPGYPNGPDVLTIVATNIGADAKISSRISWTEAQA